MGLQDDLRMQWRTGGMVVRDFLAEAASFIKSIDPNHLVSAGEEGFLKREDVSTFHNTYPWTCATGEGLDWVANAQIPDIDVLSIHAWPFQWALWGTSERDITEDEAGEYPDLSTFIPEWIAEHQRLADEIGKPLYLGEFGFQILRIPGSDVPDRDRIMEAAYDYAATTDIDGMVYWDITPSHDPEAVVYKGPLLRQSRLQSWYSDEAVPHDIEFNFDIFCPEDVTTCAIIEDFTRQMVAKVENPDPPWNEPCIAPRTTCGDACILLSSHPDHCGRCDNVCGDNEQCTAGECLPLEGEEEDAVGTGSDGCATSPASLRDSLYALVF